MRNLATGIAIGALIVLGILAALRVFVAASLQDTPGIIIVPSSTSGTTGAGAATGTTNAKFTPGGFEGPGSLPHVKGPTSNPPNY